jgi:uncharacterized protein YukE
MYVKVISDTKGLKKQIEKAGEESGQRYGKKWQKAAAVELNKGTFADAVEHTFKDMARRQAKAIADAKVKGLKSPKVELEIDPESFARLREAARHLSLNFDEEMEANYISVEKYAEMVKRSEVQLSREAEREKDANRRKQYERYLKWQRRTTEKYAAMAASDEQLRKQRLRYLIWDAKTTQKYAKMSAAAKAAAEKVVQKDRDDFERKWRREFNETNAQIDKSTRRLNSTLKAVGSSLGSMASGVRGLRVSLSKDVDKDSAAFTRLITKMKETGKSSKDLDLVTRVTRKMSNSLRRMGTGGFFDSLTNGMAAVVRSSGVFGRVVSKFVTGPIKLLGSGVEIVGNQLQKMSKKMGKGSGLVNGLGVALAGAGKAAKLLANPIALAVAAVTALTVGFGLLNAVLSAAVAAISAVVGVMTMLASAAYAAASQIVLLVPVIGALGLGIAGLVVGGMDSAKAIGLLAKAMNETDPKKRAKLMKEYNRELQKLGPNARAAMTELEVLTRGFTDLKKNAGEALFDGMDKALKKAKPLIKELENGLVLVAGAVGDVIDKFLSLGADVKFMEDFKTMFKGTETTIKNLGTAFVDVFAGLNSFFAAIQPLVDKFTQGIADAAKGFRDWAQSEEGREKTKDWFTTAYEVGSKVWAIIKELVLAFHDLFTAGMESDTTSSMLDTILEKVKQFHEWIKRIAEDGTLEEWFKRAAGVAGALWDAISQVGGALAGLGGEGASEGLESLIRGIGKVITAMIYLSQFAAMALKPMLFFLQPVIDMMKGLVNAIIKAGEWFNRLKKDGGSAMDALKAKIQPIIDAFNKVRDAVQRVIDKIKGIKFPSMPSWLPGFAAGGITMGPSIVGEAGPEMVIPLTRPLSQVDPSVRAIAAMLRGQSSDQVIMGGSTSPTKIVNNEIKVYAPSADPEAVAAQVVNRSVAMAQ